ncbi:1-deoxy-D-xylulose-5-phosphate synthase [Marinobacterium marinum]|uniref:1-deoxy-D-xylulose-5-phosphate synthase n=1 Tax=Marinobacterium marinum TaxID=2756129 RepID=A0A7W1X039_9GAMM|nr:1-deoxy-D-xylulose-5-phosphate synthase [Marinobacterium marinum]MBA4503371.1 1-deoxy-D-xylulose-5-phosphate synthase [Marinobacterium marinum]
MLHQIPTLRPPTPLLDQIDSPRDLRNLPPSQLPQLARELRAFLLYSVSQTGGHFGAGLGVVELTIALHYRLQTPDDDLVWDVGHQSYPHKILTGRREQMLGIRQKGGLSPFPKRDESPYDTFGTGHSSTSISAALGMALAHRLQGQTRHAVAVIGDGAMTAGMAFEALHHAAHTGANLLVVLNDNDMSISRNEGGLANYLARQLKQNTDTPVTAELFKALELGYIGPVDGHDFSLLLPALERALAEPGPRLLHVITRKGKGFAPAEADPVGYHSLTKLEPPATAHNPAPVKRPKYCNVFGRWLCTTAAVDNRLVGITPAMREGSDLVAFSERFPERYFDVAIAEQHAATLAAGLACRQMKPVLAIYSTFLQRAYDQVVHDIALQKLDVLLAVDRAGLVGEDGATHAGCFDITYLRCLPHMVVMTPADEDELEQMLTLGHEYPGPAAVRYPRGSAALPQAGHPIPVRLGKSRTLRSGRKVALLNFGPLLATARQVAEAHDYTLVDMRFVTPLDQDIINQLAAHHELLVSIEDHSIRGGAGSAIAEHLQAAELTTPLLILGIPDRWIAHASRQEQLSECGLDATGIETSIRQRMGS